MGRAGAPAQPVSPQGRLWVQPGDGEQGHCGKVSQVLAALRRFPQLG